jgi:hypothetical protein
LLEALGRDTYEAYKDDQQRVAPEGSEKFRLRRMPDLLPVGMQNQLHGGKPEMREEINQ